MCMYIHHLLLLLFKQQDVHSIFIYSNQPNERLPDIIWCREPFLEVMKDIDDMSNSN